MADDNKPGLLRRAAGKLVGTALHGTGSLGQYAESKVSGRPIRGPSGMERRASPGVFRSMAGAAAGIALTGTGSVGRAVVGRVRGAGGGRNGGRIPGVGGKDAVNQATAQMSQELQEVATKIAEDINDVRSDMEDGMTFLYGEIKSLDKQVAALRRSISKKDPNSSTKSLNAMLRDAKGRFVKADATPQQSFDDLLQAMGKTKANTLTPGILEQIIKAFPGMKTILGGAAAAGAGAAGGSILKRLAVKSAGKVGYAAGAAVRTLGPAAAVIGGTAAVRHSRADKDAIYEEQLKKRGKKEADHLRDVRNRGITGWMNNQLDDLYEKITGSSSTDATKKLKDDGTLEINNSKNIDIDTKYDISFKTTRDILLKGNKITLDASKIDVKGEITLNGQSLGVGQNMPVRAGPGTASNSMLSASDIRYDENVSKYGRQKADELKDVQDNRWSDPMRVIKKLNPFSSGGSSDRATATPGSGRSAGDGGRTPSGGGNGPIGGSVPTDGSMKGNDLRKGVYNSFRKQGYSHEGALVMAGEVNRENGFNPDLVFGTHKDPHNNQVNGGMFSWQKERGTALMEHLAKNGALDERGGIKRDQNSLDQMAAFAKSEMDRKEYGGGRLNEALKADKIDRNALADDVGKNYIKWRVDDPAYRSGGIRNREAGYNATSKAVQEASDNKNTPVDDARKVITPESVIQGVTGQRDYKNHGTVQLPGQDGKMKSYSFVTGGGGKGSIPHGEYDIDSKMMPAGVTQGGYWLSNRWKLTQKGQPHDTASDPGIPGATRPSQRSAFRIHSSKGEGTLGCIGILGGDKVYADFQKDLMTVLSKNGGKVTMRIGDPQAQQIMSKMDKPPDNIPPIYSGPISSSPETALSSMGKETKEAIVLDPGSPAVPPSFKVADGAMSGHLSKDGKMSTMATAFGRSKIITGLGENFNKLPKDVQDHLKNASQIDLAKIAPHQNLIPTDAKKSMADNGLTFTPSKPAVPPTYSETARPVVAAKDYTDPFSTESMTADAIKAEAKTMGDQLAVASPVKIVDPSEKNEIDAAADSVQIASHAEPVEVEQESPTKGLTRVHITKPNESETATVADKSNDQPAVDRIANSGGESPRSSGGSSSGGSLRAPVNHPESEGPSPGSDGYGDQCANPDGGGLCAV